MGCSLSCTLKRKLQLAGGAQETTSVTTLIIMAVRRRDANLSSPSHSGHIRTKFVVESNCVDFRMEFKHAKDKCHLAYCYPYTFSRLQHYLERLSSSSPDHIRRRSLCQTLGGFSCDLLTITDFDCTPEQMRRRRGVVLTARVHPGESNASWIMQVIAC